VSLEGTSLRPDDDATEHESNRFGRPSLVAGGGKIPPPPISATPTVLEEV